MKTFYDWCIENNREDLLNEWHPTKNAENAPYNIGYGSNKKVWWQCNKGHEWQTQIWSRTKRRSGCPKCSEYRKVSFPEKAIFYYIKQVFPKAYENYKLPHTNNLELDIFIEDINLGIEYDGCFYHKNYKRDIKKYSICKEYSLSLIRVREKNCPIVDDIVTVCYYLKDFGHRDLNNAIRFIFKFINDNYKTINIPVIDVEKDNLNIFNLIEIQEKENSLINKKPELAKEWHPTKNNKLTPSNTNANSKVKVWWICERGHEYKAPVNARYACNTGCPICANKQVKQGYNDLATTHPEIAKEWHPTKNGDLKPTEVIAGSDKKVWWQCEKGHEWQAGIETRTLMNAGCPYCTNRKVWTGYNDVATVRPDLVEEWHPTKNGNLKPSDISIFSNNRVWWKCKKCGHEWKTAITYRKDGTGCPRCANLAITSGYNDLATTHPEIAKEWHPTKNGDLKPTEVVIGGSKKVWWMCEKGHEWQTNIKDRTKGGCPYCSNKKVLKGYNDMATTHPQIAKEWNYKLNGDLKPTDISIGSNKKVWWKCKKCGHEWQAPCYYRKEGSGCPECRKKKKR
ncbi:MAG: zinc-ribbon domain-containing protein [Candidatus Gastranaerophilales bacterium]|nr:zinc-ribbon domain-containing protein [Candidatus Gastranaerophilales bacterium]